MSMLADPVHDEQEAGLPWHPAGRHVLLQGEVEEVLSGTTQVIGTDVDFRRSVWIATQSGGVVFRRCDQ